jgi:hypothetical protein
MFLGLIFLPSLSARAYAQPGLASNKIEYFKTGAKNKSHHLLWTVSNMRDTESFIKAYHELRKTIDFEKDGILPDLENLVWCILIGVPYVPADEYNSEDESVIAIDQRTAILKAVFVEVNKNQPEVFLDKGLLIYDQANRMAKKLLDEQEIVNEIKKVTVADPIDEPAI